MSKLFIKNGYILTMEQEIGHPGDYYFQGNVVIEDGKITKVLKDLDENFSTQGYEIIDASGMVVMPGLVNCHTHAAMTLLRGYADDLPLMEWLEKKIWPLEAKLEPEHIYWGTKLAILEMIKGGTTCFADMYFAMELVAEAVEETGIRSSLCRGMIAANNGEQALKESIEFINKWHNGAGGRITTMLGPHAPYTCDPKFLNEVVSEAKKLNVGIHIHLAETRTEVKQIEEQYGKTPTELVYEAGLMEVKKVLAAHCVHLTEADLRILAENNNVGVAHNPESNMKLASGIAPVNEMIKMDIKVGIGTDGAASNNNLDMFQEMRSAALLQKVSTYDPTVISSYQALSMATKNGACVLGLDEEIGMLRPGMKADLILVNLKEPHLHPIHDINAHLVYSAGASDVDTVIIDGKIVMRHKEVKTIDEEKVLYEVGEIVNQITKA